MKNKFTSIAALVMSLGFFLAVGWYWNKASQPNFDLCPLCNEEVKR